MSANPLPGNIAKWYRSPSGLLLLAGLVLIAAGIVSNGLVSIAGLLLVAFFIPYKSLRDRQIIDRQLDGMRTSIASTRELLEAAQSDFASKTIDAAAEQNSRFAKSTAALSGQVEELDKDRQKNEAGLAASTELLTGRTYLPFTRSIQDHETAPIIEYWADRLNLEIETAHIRYLERKFVFVEGICDGRVATTSTDAVIRCLVGKSLAKPDNSLEILEIGTLFGLGSFTLHQALFPFVKTCKLTLLDPLEGYYGNDTPDPATGVRITEDVLWSNCDRLSINRENVRVIKGYSTDAEILERARQAYDLIIIDGDHSYDGVRLDFELYSGFIKEDGLLIVDDYGSTAWPDVTRYTDEVIKKDQRFEFVGAQSRTGVFRRVGSD